MFSLNAKSALVIGAGSGIGREIALLFGKHGPAVFIGDISPDAAAKLATQITIAGGRAEAISLDVTSLDWRCRRERL